MLEFSTPQKAIAAFERFTGLRITVHDFERSLLQHLPASRYTHHYGLCHKVKESIYDPFCLRFGLERLQKQIATCPEGRWQLCHAGLIEWLIPLVEEQRLVWVLFAGARSPGNDLKHVYRDAESCIHANLWKHDPLYPLPVEDEEAEHLMEMLRQLAARLWDWRARYGQRQLTGGEPKREFAIRTFISQNCMNPIQIKDLAAHLHLSRSRAAHLVHEVCKAGFVELLTEARISRAGDLLRHTDDPIARVAARSGFDNVSHFHRMFRQKLGMTPRQYRLQREVSPVGGDYSRGPKTFFTASR